MKLFREEILESQAQRGFGTVLLFHPPSHYVLTFAALSILGAVLLLITFGHYTRHESITGVLEPTQGIVKLYATQSGVLKLLNVREGQRVNKGDILLIFTSEHKGADGKAVEEALASKGSERLDHMCAGLGSTLKLQESDADDLRENLAAQLVNRDVVHSQIDVPSLRVKSAAEALQRYEHLQQAGFAPDMQVQSKRDELLDQRLRLQDLQRTAKTIGADIPRKGSALFFAYPEASEASGTLHGGEPVLDGEKWIMTKWLREADVMAVSADDIRPGVHNA